MNPSELIAIDIHTHAERSCRQPVDEIQTEFDAAATTYFKADSKRPTIAETVAYYRERKIGFVMFTVDSESGTGIQRISNEEIAEAARDNADIMLAFASIDPHKGKAGAREARRLIRDYGVKGFKFHPPMQNYNPSDPMAWPIYEVIAEHKLPAIFHTGHSGMGTGMPGGGGIRLKYGQPILVDDVAVDFPDMQIILAHPSWPWTDEALSMALHKPNVFIDLSGWSPKYFPPQIVRYANTQLGHKMLFGSDFPLIPPEKWIAAFDQAGFKPELREPILKGNASKLLFGH
ncbi:MAG TPA: amidohydrolase family protein [Polyangiales bacterium]|nr:amidohydrolase family protein [Polyangiales bacterium]